MKNVKNVVKSRCCTSCGLCFPCFDKIINRNGVVIPDAKRIKKDFDMRWCPGTGYDIKRMAYSGYDSKESIELGSYLGLYAFSSDSERITRNAASAGAMTTLAATLLTQKIVDGVIVSEIVNENGCLRSRTFVASSQEQLYPAQGSKYMPVPALDNIDALLEDGKKYAYIGTPCQIAGIKKRGELDSAFKEKIVFCIGNFCGGYRDTKERAAIFKMLGVKEADVTDFAYRRGRQPGYMLIKTKSGEEWHLSYPKYSKLTGFPVVRRCRLCVDSTAELADISCGDGWIERFMKTGRPWSFIILRTPAAVKLFEAVRNIPGTHIEDISEAEVIESQKGNITSKKYRQAARYKLYSRLGCKLPDFDGGYRTEAASVKKEAKVLLAHSFFLLLQKLGLYLKVARFLGRTKQCKIEKINTDKAV